MGTTMHKCHLIRRVSSFYDKKQKAHSEFWEGPQKRDKLVLSISPWWIFTNPKWMGCYITMDAMDDTSLKRLTRKWEKSVPFCKFDPNWSHLPKYDLLWPCLAWFGLIYFDFKQFGLILHIFVRIGPFWPLLSMFDCIWHYVVPVCQIWHS